MKKYIEKYYGVTKKIPYIVFRRKIMNTIFKTDGCYRKDLLDNFSENNRKNAIYQICNFIETDVIIEHYFNDERKDIFLKLTDKGIYLYCVWFFNKKMKDTILLLGKNIDHELRLEDISRLICDYNAESQKRLKSQFDKYVISCSKKLKKYCDVMVKRNVLIVKDHKKNTLYGLTANGLAIYDTIKDKIEISGILKNESFE